MDEAIGLLKWALEILERDERPEVEILVRLCQMFEFEIRSTT